MKYRVGDLFKWVNDECHVPDAMGDVYVLVKDYTLLKGATDAYAKKEEDTYSLLTVYSSEGDYLPFSSELPYEVIEDRIDQCLYRVGNVADINSCETVEFDDDYDDDDYSVEEDDDEWEEEEDEVKDILDLIERFEEVYDDDDYDDDDYDDDDYDDDDDDYLVEEDDSEYEEEEDKAKDILDLIERSVKHGTTLMSVVRCDKIHCEDCPFSYDSKLNENHKGCASLSPKEINNIARRFLNGEER